MKNQTVLLAGATGLVGGECLSALQASQWCGRINAAVRSPYEGLSRFSKAREFLVNFDDPASLKPAAACDAAVCALGTTMARAGSREAFYKVDFTYCLETARAALEGGAKHLLLVTAMGASPGSRVFYNRVKGELEQAVMGMGFACVSIFRPSLLLGDRREFRFSEEMGKFFAQMFRFAIPARYKAIQAAEIARAIVKQASNPKAVSRIFESHEIRALGGTA